MTTLIEDKTMKILAVIRESIDGITKNELISVLNEKYSNSIIFSSYLTLDDVIETNLLTGRLTKKNNQLAVTDKGESYLKITSL